MTYQERRQKSPDAIRMRSVVERSVDDPRETADIFESVAPTDPWLKRALTIGTDWEVVGAAWLHDGPSHVWPGIVLVVSRADGQQRTVLIWPRPTEQGPRWYAQVSTNEVRDDQLFYLPGGITVSARPTPEARSGSGT